MAVERLLDRALQQVHHLQLPLHERGAAGELLEERRRRRLGRVGGAAFQEHGGCRFPTRGAELRPQVVHAYLLPIQLLEGGRPLGSEPLPHRHVVGEVDHPAREQLERHHPVQRPGWDAGIRLDQHRGAGSRYDDEDLLARVLALDDAKAEAVKEVFLKMD